MKSTIRAHEEVVKNLEQSVKDALKRFTTCEGQLQQEKDKAKKLGEDSKKVITILERNGQTHDKLMQEREKEIDKLKEKNNILLRNLDQKQLELEKFQQHRDQVLSQYEDLVKNKSNELEFSKKEVSNFEKNFLSKILSYLISKQN